MLFSATPSNPFHFSCKTLIINGDKALLVHSGDYKFSNGSGLGEFYSLVRETMEADETVEETIIRGAAEELGVLIKPLYVIGSSEHYFKNGIGSREYPWHKSSLYMISQYIDDSKKHLVKGADTQHQPHWANIQDVPELLSRFDPFDGELSLDSGIIDRWLRGRV